jgi:hypothetical protein
LKTAQTKEAPSASEPATSLERLHADRAGLVSELAGLNASSSRLRETANAEAAVLREIGEMGTAEIAAMTAWASAGCLGDQPVPDQKERRALAEKLSAAQSAAAAAKGAGQDIDDQIVQRSEQLAAINNQIEVAIFDQVERQHGDVISEYVGVCERASALATQISGLALFFRETGNHKRAAVIFTTKLPAVSTNPTEIKASADIWGRRIASLRKGTAS